MIKIFDNEVVVKYYPDGTQHIEMPNIVKDMRDLFYGGIRSTIEVNWNYESDEELITLIYTKGYLDEKYNKPVNLNMFYIPNARMDRVRGYGDVFTLKYFAQIINSLNFDTVNVLDPHSTVSEALIDRIKIHSPKPFIEKVLDNTNVDTLFFPDEGAMKRYSKMFDMPFVFGVKNRDWKTGNILSLDVIGDQDLINGKNILIIDDICSKGGTFYHSAKKLKELGANKIYLFVSHCEDTIRYGDLLDEDLIECIWTTDSLITIEHEKIKVISIDEVIK